MPTVHDVIVHCQKQIKKDPPEEKLLHYLSRLDRLRVTVQDLMDTGVGRTVNQLSRHGGGVGKEALKLVKKWKDMVSEENSDSESSSGSSSGGGESEAEVPEEERNGHRVRPTVNGNQHQRHRQSESDEFNADSDDDRLCIADEDDKSIKAEKAPSPSPIVFTPVKQEKHIQSSPEESENEELYPISNDFNNVTENSTGYNDDHIKSERLSESENSSAESSNDVQTQCIPQNIQKAPPLIKKSHSSEDDDYIKNHNHDDKYKRTPEKDVHKHKRSESEKHNKRHKHRSSEKTSLHKGSSSTTVSQRANIKVEPKDDEESTDDQRDYQHHSSPSKRKKDRKRSKEKDSKSSDKHKSREKDHSHHSHKSKIEDHSRHKSKNKDKGDKKERRKHDDDKERKRSSEKRTNSSSPDRKKIKLENSRHLAKKSSIHIDEEINSESGVKFEELLGCLDKGLSKSKDKHKEKSSKSHSSSSSKPSGNKVKEEITKLTKRNNDSKKYGKQVESIIAPTLNISPNYKPPAASALFSRPLLPKPSTSINILESCGDPGTFWEDNRMISSRESNNNAEDALASMITSRKERTKVFSGRCIGVKGLVPSLFDLCMQVIQENIGDLGYTGGVPYEILKPALERATAQQLLIIEEYNPYLIGSTDELWKFHASREFRGRERQEMETWRELFERCTSERDEKFKVVRTKMLKKGEVAAPVRKAKLAYVEPIGGPRFNRQKTATIKNGMKSLKIKEEKGPRKGVGSSASVGFNNPTENSKIVVEHAVIINPESRAGHAPAPSVSRGEAVAKFKPRKAPLMQKTMKFIKSLKRR